MPPVVLASRVTVVSTAGGTLVVRSQPRGMTSMMGFNRLGRLWQHLRRRLRRDRAWTLVVRRFEADPFGPVLHREDVPAKADVAAAVDRLVDGLRQGSVALPEPADG